MPNFKKGPQAIVINSESHFPIIFFKKLTSGDYNLIETDDTFAVGAGTVTEGSTYAPDADGVVTNITAADIDMMKITGFADFFKGQILEASKVAAVNLQTQNSTLTITIPSAIVAGKEVVIDAVLSSLDNKSEYASYYNEYQRTRSYPLITLAGDTVTTLANRVVADLNKAQEGKNPHFVASNSAGVITITPVDPLMKFSFSARFTTEAGIAIAHAVTVPAYEGRGTWYNLSREFLQTDATIFPYNDLLQRTQPIKDNLYACYTIVQSVTREELSLEGGVNMAPTGKFYFTIWVNQNLTATISKLNGFLNAHATTKRNYSATTAAAAIAAETPTTTLA